MASQEEKAQQPVPAKTQRGGDKSRTLIVEESGATRPYMRGIMVHSLMARGVSFEEAYGAAGTVGKQIKGRESVPRAELKSMLQEILGTVYEHQPPIPIPIRLQVVDDKSSTPFSKGTLSQSLLAASVEPDDAFDVARQIELEILRSGRQEITHKEIRRLAYRTLLDRFGHRAAERYLVWREYQEPEKPVIVLLGGTTGVGKTSLALEVARRLGISRVLSTDSIRQVMRIMLSPELMPAIHTSSFEAHRKTPVQISEEDPEVEGFIAQASVVSVGVRAIIERAIEENTSLVLDGVSLVPGLVEAKRYAESAHVFFLLVARLDVESFRKHFAERAGRQKKRFAKRYVDRLEEILRIQEYLLEQAENHDVPIVDNISLEGSVLLVIRHVVETLRKNRDVEVLDLL